MRRDKLKKQELIKKVYENLKNKKYWVDKARHMEEYIKAYMNHEKIMSKLMDIDKKKLENYIEHCKKQYGYKENAKVEKEVKEEPKEQKKEVKEELNLYKKEDNKVKKSNNSSKKGTKSK